MDLAPGPRFHRGWYRIRLDSRPSTKSSVAETRAGIAAIVYYVVRLNCLNFLTVLIPARDTMESQAGTGAAGSPQGIDPGQQSDVSGPVCFPEVESTRRGLSTIQKWGGATGSELAVESTRAHRGLPEIELARNPRE